MSDIQTSSEQWSQSIEGINAALGLLDGATLEWVGTTVSHGNSVWRLTDLPQGMGYIFMMYTQYIHLPLVMHDIRARVASAEEIEAVRSQFFPDPIAYLREQDYLFIDCREGTFSLWAHIITVLWGERDFASFLGRM